MFGVGGRKHRHRQYMGQSAWRWCCRRGRGWHGSGRMEACRSLVIPVSVGLELLLCLLLRHSLWQQQLLLFLLPLLPTVAAVAAQLHHKWMLGRMCLHHLVSCVAHQEFIVLGALSSCAWAGRALRRAPLPRSALAALVVVHADWAVGAAVGVRHSEDRLQAAHSYGVPLYRALAMSTPLLLHRHARCGSLSCFNPRAAQNGDCSNSKVAMYV